MDRPRQPNKEQVRHEMAHRRVEHKPPPDPKQVRRELGLEMIEAARNKRRRY